MTPLHRFVLVLSYAVILCEVSLLVVFRQAIYDWLSHNLWVVVIPFAKGIFKRVVALKILALLKGIGVLLWHLAKLLLLKLLKTLGIRYGVFFSQRRWYWIRLAKVMFVRRGKQFFRSVSRFWAVYGYRQKWIILIAFFPIGLVIFLLGLSFNVTRKTMVQKTQETAVFKMATSASGRSSGIRQFVERLDQLTLQKIHEMTGRK